MRFFFPEGAASEDGAGFDRKDVNSSPHNYFGDPNAASAKPQEGQTPTFWKRPISSVVATAMHDVVLAKNISTLQAELQSREWRKLNGDSSGMGSPAPFDLDAPEGHELASAVPTSTSSDKQAVPDQPAAASSV